MGLLQDSIGPRGITVQEEDGSPAVSTAIIKYPDRCVAVDHDDATAVKIRAAPK